MKNTILTLATALFLLASCELKFTNIPVTDIIITPDQMTLSVGGTPGKIEIEVAPADATLKTVELTIVPEGVVTIDEEGNVTPVGPGTATITATALLGNATETCTVTVREAASITHTYTGTFSIAPGTAAELVLEDAAIELVINPNRAIAQMKMLQVSFAPGQMPAMDITVPDISLVYTRETPFTFNGDDIVPTTVMGGTTVPVPTYTITGLEGEGTPESLSWSMMCGPYPLSFEGTHTAE